MKEPLVSYIILSYNHEKYIKDAISSAINQDYKNIEFIILDDSSIDNTIINIKDELKGCERPVFYKRHKNNLGLIKNLEYGLNLAKGDIIVLAAGDDIACSSRVSDTVSYISKYNYSFVSFNDLNIDSDGVVGDSLFNMKKDQEVTLGSFCSSFDDIFSGASRGFNRRVFDFFGKISTDCPTEDTPYLLRCLMYGNGIVLNKPGIYYRTHDNNLSSTESLNKMNLNAIRKQYTADVTLALNNTLIKNEDKIKINIWIAYISLIKKAARLNGIKKIGIYLYAFMTCKLFRVKLFNKILMRF